MPRPDNPDKIACPKCGLENNNGAFGCLHCGHILEETEVRKCSKCGYENTADLLECLNCGHVLQEGFTPEGDLVELFSTSDPGLASRVGEQLHAAGIHYEKGDETARSEMRSPLTFSKISEMKAWVSPTTFLVPPEQLSQAEGVLHKIGQTVGGYAAPGEPAAEPEPARCPKCETLYHLEDYDPLALRILCTACGAELPRHPPRRF